MPRVDAVEYGGRLRRTMISSATPAILRQVEGRLELPTAHDGLQERMFQVSTSGAAPCLNARACLDRFYPVTQRA